MQKTSVAHIARMQLEKAARAMCLSEDTITVLKWTKRILQVTFPIRRDDVSVVCFTGYRCQSNGARRPTSGGVRYYPDVSADERNFSLRAAAYVIALERIAEVYRYRGFFSKKF